MIARLSTGWEVVLADLAMILFLVFEPLGLVGIWHRIQTYFLLWPFKHRPVAGARK